MKPIRLEPQPPSVSVDENTLALLKQAQASAQRGETVTLDQASRNLRRRLEELRLADGES